MRTISQRELRNDSGAVLRAVEGGESLIVTRNGVPIAELRPLGRRRLVPSEDWAAIIDRLPPVDWRGMRADIDTSVEQALPGDHLAS